MKSAQRHVQLDYIATKVKELHDRDEALSKTRAKTKVEQRKVRLEIGALVSVVSDADLHQIAEKSGYTEARLKNFSFVFTQWPAGTFPEDVSYTPLEELARDPERFAKITSGMSKRDARAAKGGKVDTPSRWSAATKAQFIKEALADPEVARATAQDVETRAAIAKAENDVYREQLSNRDPSQRGQRSTVQGDTIVRQLVNARYAVNRSLDMAMDDTITLSAAKREEILAALAEITTSVDWMKSFIESGDTSFEQALADLFRSQEN